MAALGGGCLSRAAPSQPFHSSNLCGTNEVGARSHLLLRDSQAAGNIGCRGCCPLPPWGQRCPLTPTVDAAAGLTAGSFLGGLFSATRYSLTQGQISSLEAQSLSLLVLIWAALKSPPSTRAPHGISRGHCPLSIPPLLSVSICTLIWSLSLLPRTNETEKQFCTLFRYHRVVWHRQVSEEMSRFQLKVSFILDCPWNVLQQEFKVTIWDPVSPE